MNNQQKGKILVELLGGAANVKEVVNCMTRARFIVKDKTKIKEDKLKEQDFVLGVNDAGEQYQIILGPGAAKKVVDQINEDYQFDAATSSEQNTENNWQENKKKLKKETPVSGFLKKIGQVFIPMIPGFIASGILLGFANIILNLAVSNNAGVQPEQMSAIYYFLHALGMGLYGYLAIFTGINTAKIFGGSEILGGIIGALTISGELPQIFMALGFSEQFSSSMIAKGGIFGVLFAVIFMSFVEKKIRKLMPDMLDLIVTPIITLLVTGVATVFAFMLIAGVVTDGIDIVLNFLVGQSGFKAIISGAVIAGMFLPLVTFGLHQGFTPIYLDEIARNGATYIFPIAAMAGAGQVGAAISIFFQAKKQGDTRMQKIISGAIIPGFLGVGEPLIYGVTLPLGKPFITAGIGAACGGAYVAFAQVGAVATGPSGLTALPLILPVDMLQYIIGLLIAYIFGFIATQFMFKYEPQY